MAGSKSYPGGEKVFAMEKEKMNSGKAIHRTATLAKGRKTKAFRKQQRKDRARNKAEQAGFENRKVTLTKLPDSKA